MAYKLRFGPVFLTIFFLAFQSRAEMYGLFMVVKGDVKVAATGKAPPAAIKVGSKILPGETVISGPDSRAKIVMSDRNVINVSPSTTLKIEKYENDSKSGKKNVILNLDEGKARTNVEQKYDGDRNQFILKTPSAVAGVRGTEFVVSYSSATQMTQVVTLKGSVTFAPANAPAGSAPVVVNKGESTSMAAGAAAPEAPKIVPKEELKKIDQESTGQTAPAATQTEEKKAARTTASDGGDGKTAGAAEPDAPKKDAPKKAVMIDTQDMDTATLKREVTSAAPAGAPKAVTPMPPPPPPAPPTISPAIDEVVKKKYENTKIKIVPVVR